MLVLSIILIAQVLVGNGALRPGGSGISGPFQQTKDCVGNFATNPSTTCVFTNNVDLNSLGATLVVYAASGGAQTAWNTPTKSAGTATVGTFTLQGSCTSGNASGNQCVWTAPITATGTLTVTISAASSSNTSIIGAVYELNNQVVGTTDVVSTYENHATCTSCTLAGLTTTGANRAVLTFLSRSTSTTWTNPSPFVFDINKKDSQNAQIADGHYIQVTAGAYTPTVTGISAAFSDVSIAIF